jgi:transcriptional pleiotropic regulator of transition state genes
MQPPRGDGHKPIECRVGELQSKKGGRKKQTSKIITKGGGITIPRGMRQETGILPGVPVDVVTYKDGIHIVKHIPVCRFCGNTEDVAAVCGIEICRECAGKIREVFK